VACGDSRFDRTKFENVNVAAENIRRDVTDTGGVGSAQFPENSVNSDEKLLLSGSGSTDAGKALCLMRTAAAETYSYF
jgi:hypothetical protein